MFTSRAFSLAIMDTEVRQKRKKTSRACNHCHKAHMTCDSGRPCRRCIQRKLDKTCEDAPRKRKKYLLDVPQQVLAENQSEFYQEGWDQQLQNQVVSPPVQTPPILANPPLTKPPLTTPPINVLSQRNQFMSSAVDLEYSTLSNILQDVASTDSNPQSPASNSPHTHNPRVGNQYLQTQPQLYDKHFKCDDSINQYFLGDLTGEMAGPITFPDVISAIDAIARADPAAMRERNSKSALSFTVGIGADDVDYNSNMIYKEPEEIYQNVKQPYPYTPGYHALIAYLRKRFPKPMLVKMAESMAAYRPSFIACTNSLKEEDLIFMEQCFQRTLLTYDSFIRVNGTPTIVWRRTGEIVYVGHEFCFLTGWSKEQLIGKTNRKLIVELLDDKSVVEYFQLFSRIAFGDFLGATMTECTLLTPNPQVKVRTGCIWTLKRDVFGIPMMIIGNFLPIL